MPHPTTLTIPPARPPGFITSHPSLILAAVCLGWALSAEAAPAKNVLLIMVDDLRPQLAGIGSVPTLHGVGIMQTPALDRLAREGTVFERAYCSVPICGASRLSLLTGSRPYKEPGRPWGRHWFYTSRLDVEDAGTPAGINHPGVTLPRHFKDHGYTLLSIDKVYHNPQDDRALWNDLVKEPHPWGGLPAYEIGSGEKDHDEAYPDGRNTAHVLAKLDELKDQPFLYCVGFPRPHLPFWAPQKYWDLYPEASIELPPNYSLPIHAPSRSIHNWGELRHYTEVAYADAAQTRLTDAYARTLIRGYYASVSYVDAQISRIIAKLKNTRDAAGVSLYDKTTIVLWSDHGWNLGEHTLWAKHALYNTATQIPLIIRDPDFAGGRRVRALVESVDLYPTLCDMVGIGRPAPTIDNDGSRFNLHGSSLLPLLRDARAPWKPAAFSRYLNGDSVRTDRYAYSEFVNDQDEVLEAMLFDLQADPHENYNIVGSNPQLAQRLSALLGHGAVGKRNAWRAFVDETRHNAPTAAPLDLPAVIHPADYLEQLARFTRPAVTGKLP